MIDFSKLIPKSDELKRRTEKKQAVKPTEESIKVMEKLFDEFGYDKENESVYLSVVSYGALLLDDTAYKGMILSGGNGIGKTFGVEILASHFKFPVFTPQDFVSIIKDLEGNIGDFEKIVITGGDFFDKPNHIAIDELGIKDTARNYGEVFDIMCDVLDIRYRAFNRYGVKTIITTNLDKRGIYERYGKRINDRISEMFYFKIVDGKSRRTKNER